MGKRMDLIEEAKSFLTMYIKGKSSNGEKSYPWRNDWKFVIRHSIRVESFAKEIMSKENSLSDKDKLMISMASILHDIGTFDDKKNHAKVGSDIVKNWCTNKDFIEKNVDTKKLITLIANHSKKEGKEKDSHLAILKDADILDEIGAMSIVKNIYDSNAKNDAYFNEVMEKLEKEEIPMIQKKRDKLTTKTAKVMLDKKIKFIKDFINELKSELMGTDGLNF